MKLAHQSSTALFCIALGISTLYSLKTHAQSSLFSKDNIKTLCYLDGEIIYDPEASMTLQALETINPKDIDVHHLITEQTALKLYGPRGKSGVYLLYSKKDPASINRNRIIIQNFCTDYKVAPFEIYRDLHPNDSLINCFALKSGEIPAEFPGGNQALGKFIGEHLKMPEDAKANMIMGKVTIGFLIEETGVLSEIKPIYGKNLGCNLAAEAVKIMTELPRMYPATYKGKPRKSFSAVTITYKISEQEAPLEASN